MEMYKASYFGLNHNTADERFKMSMYFTSKAKALDYLRLMTNEKMEKDHRSEMPCTTDLYCHIVHFVESEGVLLFRDSAIFSLYPSNGTLTKNEGKTALLTSL